MQLHPGDWVVASGRFRHGKTATVTRMAYRLYRQGWPVYANYDVRFAQRLTKLEEVYECRDCVLLLDELMVLVDSRKSASAQQVEFTQIGAFFGKRGVIILGTVSHLSFVDVRIRTYMSLYLQCQKWYVRRAPWCRVSVLWPVVWPSGAQTFTRLGNYAYPLASSGGLYDTLDEDVYLDTAPTERQRRGRRGGGSQGVVVDGVSL
ncbi:MAG TPA: hypothetical protein VFS21_40305 [Roseiflexaceae bacterium]|nr:hypothetical protein [Roseiflexaceae bacterium]